MILCLHATRQDHLSVHGLRENRGALEDEDIVNATLKDDVTVIKIAVVKV
jgi:hypothetical protein